MTGIGLDADFQEEADGYAAQMQHLANVQHAARAVCAISHRPDQSAMHMHCLQDGDARCSCARMPSGGDQCTVLLHVRRGHPRGCMARALNWPHRSGGYHFPAQTQQPKPTAEPAHLPCVRVAGHHLCWKT